jgi:hypothetical protein
MCIQMLWFYEIKNFFFINYVTLVILHGHHSLFFGKDGIFL